MNDRQISITRFALDYLKANLWDCQNDDLLEDYSPPITEQEIDDLKNQLGVS